MQIFDATQNPCRLRETWSEAKWDTAVTAVALYDFHQSILVAEKGMTFSASTDNKIKINKT